METLKPPTLPQVDHQVIDAIYRQHHRRVFATLVRLLGDFALAEEALHDAFEIALVQWAHSGVPANPSAWLVSTAKFTAIDHLRRARRFVSLETQQALLDALVDSATPLPDAEAALLEDDQLRLIFTCCHPSLAVEAQVALTLREVCGLSTEEIAHAFLLTPSSLAQRIVRAKGKIRDAKIPYEVPEKALLPARLESVLQVIYLLFNEAYSASHGTQHMRADLSAEAIRLARLVHDLLPEAEVKGLLALLLLHESRRPARSDSEGNLLPLEEQQRSLWQADLIAEGIQLVESALRSRQFGGYSLQAAISAVHAEASTAAQTDWRQILGLYDALLQLNPSPIVQLNRAIAVAMCDGPLAGLLLLDTLLAQEALQHYHLAHAARADFYRRLGRKTEAIAAYQMAMSLTKQAPEQRYLAARIAQLQA
jgi:RNA polymerase sigma-70 factor, ECF subfamily